MAANARTVLIVDDEPAFCALLGATLERDGFATRVAATGYEALAALAGPDEFHVVLLDVMMPDLDGLETLRRLKALDPHLPVIMLSARGDTGSVVEAVRGGALDYLRKPFDADRLRIALANAVRTYELERRVLALEDQLERAGSAEDFIGRSPAMRQVFQLIEKVSRSDATVLITGESGTGKEKVARTIHRLSPRRDRPFVVVNCGAIPATLIESELFGHEKGAFTGAGRSTPGRFEQAHGGTLFLDEIGEMRLDTQVRLLRAVQEREVQRVGGGQPIRTDIRLLVATNKNLRDEVAAGRFREDLYYRISVFPIELPPLRARDGDVAILAYHFLHHFAGREKKPVQGFEPEALKCLEAYPWPGNVRELMNLLERLILVEEGPRIRPASLPEHITRGALAAAGGRRGNGRRVEAPIIVPFAQEEERIIVRALRITGGNVTEAAAGLGLSRATLYRKLKKYGRRAGPGC